jgi:cation:H+ antiporter
MRPAMDLLSPLLVLLGFLAASALMLWRLERLLGRGFGGTLLGTLITPYCSGLGNLVFVYLMLREGGDGGAVVINCIVNNVTNLTLLLGLPALFWSLAVMPAKRAKGRKPPRRERREGGLTRLGLLFSLFAAGCFLVAITILGSDGRLDQRDGLILVGLFFFWQSYSLYEVLRDHVSEKRPLGAAVFGDLGLLLAAAGAQYGALEYLVSWVGTHGEGVLAPEHLGWLSGWLMVVPNAFLAFYYAARHQPGIVYSAQLGDGHICLPFCLGLFAVFRVVELPALFLPALGVLAAALSVHALFLLVAGRLPRWAGATLVAAYGVFCYLGWAG